MRRRALRNVTIGAALTLVIAWFASVLFLTDSLRREWSLGLEAAPPLTIQRLVAGRPALISVSAGAELLSHPAVTAVDPRVWGYVFVAPLSANVTVVGTVEELGEEDAVIGAALASQLGLRVGDRFALPAAGGARTVRVAEVFEDPSGLRSADLVMLKMATARAVLGLAEGEATDLAVTLSRESESAAVARLALQSIPRARVLERRALRRTYDLTFNGRAGWLTLASLPALLTLLLIGWERVTGLSPGERREIGVLKAVGFSTRDVLIARVFENAWLSFVASALGLCLAYLYVFVLGAPWLRDSLFGWSALFPRFALVPVVDASQLMSILALIVLPFTGISIVPAWRVAMRDVDAALRGQS